MAKRKIRTGVSYFGNRILRHAKEDMKAIAQNSCNFVVHTFSETDLAFYKDTMKALVDISHKKGLEVYVDPWAVGGIFGGESFSQFVNEHLEARQVSSEGNLVPAACMNNPIFRSFMEKWVDAACDIGGDIIFWDEPHFYIFEKDWVGATEDTLWSCRCLHCRRKFKKIYKMPMPKKLTAKVKSFRQKSVINFIDIMSKYARKKGKRNALCVLPRTTPIGGIENWEDVARSLKSIDIFGTDPYWPQDEKDVYLYVKNFSEKIVSICKKYKKEPQIWILNFQILKGKEANISKAVRAACDAGARNIAAWSYRGAESMSSLKSQRPEVVWRELGKAYRKVYKDS